jgi:hypothetical protein
MKKQIVVLVVSVLLITSLLAEGNIHKVSAENSLAAYCSFDEGIGNFAHDRSGNGNDGFIHGATWISGKVGQALKLNGIDEYVSIPLLFPSDLSSLTVSVWINSNMNSTGEGTIFWHGAKNEFELISGRVYDNGDILSSVVGFGVHLTDDVWYNAYSDTIAPNTWHNIVGVWTKGVSAQLYIDGALASSKIVPDINLSELNDLRFHPAIGVYSNDIIDKLYWFEGAVDEVMVYNYARTPEQIAQYYTSPVPPTSQTPSPSLVPTPTPTSTPFSTPTKTSTSTPQPTQTSTNTASLTTSESPTPTPTSQTQLDQLAIAIAISLSLLIIAVLVVVAVKKRKRKPRKTMFPATSSKVHTEEKGQPPELLPENKPELKKTVFFSYVEEDNSLVLEIAKALETAGFSTWYYERDSIPGLSYLLQSGEAIEQSQAVILVISPHSISSNQVTNEVIAAHEAGKHFIPILYGMKHAEFQRLQPEWRRAIGSAVSIEVPSAGIAAILPRIIRGLIETGVKKEDKTA